MIVAGYLVWQPFFVWPTVNICWKLCKIKRKWWLIVFGAGSPELLVKLDGCERHGHHCSQSEPCNHVTMDTDSQSDEANNSDVDVERVSSDDEDIRNKILAQGLYLVYFSFWNIILIEVLLI